MPFSFALRLMTRSGIAICIACALWGVPALPAAAAADERCAALFEQGAAALAAERYPKMMQIAEDRMRLCPDPESAFLLGLAQANIVDDLLVSDPAAREQLRLSALRNLRVAATGTSLKPVWLFTVHDWIVQLQRLGPPDEASVQPDAAGSAAELDLQAVEVPDAPLENVPPAPPPQPQPAFPWGPAVTGVLGAGALVTGIVLGVSASSDHDEAKRAAHELQLVSSELDPQALSDAVRRTRALNDEANSKGRWSTICLIGGGAAMATALVWYFALPPKGKWRWAALPSGMQASVRF